MGSAKSKLGPVGWRLTSKLSDFVGTVKSQAVAVATPLLSPRKDKPTELPKRLEKTEEDDEFRDEDKEED